MCVLADDAMRLLGKSATWKEKFVLGGARFYDDITITHSYHEYFDKIYETKFNPELCAEPKTKAQEAQTRLAKNQGEGQGGEPGGVSPKVLHPFIQARPGEGRDVIRLHELPASVPQ